MKLQSVHIKEFLSVWDSNPFETGKVTCLVGKNEAGKTAILDAIYRLNPMEEGRGNFDETDDYPRSEVEDYRQDIENGRCKDAIVVRATFALEKNEIDAVENNYGVGVLKDPNITISKGYNKDTSGNCTLSVSVPIDEPRLVKNLIDKYKLQDDTRKKANKCLTLADLHSFLKDDAEEKNTAAADAKAAAEAISDEAQKATAIDKSKSMGESEQSKALREYLKKLLKTDITLNIWNTILKPFFPKFLYFSEYYKMIGHANIEALRQRKENNNLERSDYPLLGLIELARLDLDMLLSPERTQELKNKLQGASNHLSRKILKYWSQNKHIQIQFDVRPGLSGDPEGMRKGNNIWGEVYDTRHLVHTGLGTRSTGFVWYFSFLAWYSALKKKNEPLVLLLDEPGLSLHGKAQDDLLKFFEEEIVKNPKHQLIYTTHSPFMVDPTHFDRVRIVQDKGIDTDEPLPRGEDGTKVFTDVLEAQSDSLFPLQGALGYEIYQTLFIGPNCLVVEGVSDLLYIQTISSVLQQAGHTGLDSRWTITPVGGADKVPTFVALIGAQSKLNIVTLIDFQKSNRQLIDNLYKSKLLKKKHLLTFAEFTSKPESDIEDMFDEDLYINLVNTEFADSLQKPISSTDITSQAPRILVRLEQHFSNNPLKNGIQFNHYRLARYLTEKISSITITKKTLDRFEEAFTRINNLL